MKIAILVSMFLPKRLGGVELATQDIAGNLAKSGNDVHIITSLDKGLSKKNNKDGFIIHRIFYPKIKFLGIIFFWLKCLFLIKKINPEISHSQTIQMGFPCFMAKKLFDIPYIVYCHGSDVYFPWRFKKMISKWVLENADAIIVLTENMKKEINSFGFNLKNIFIIPNGIEPNESKDLSRNDMRKDLKIDEVEKIILFVGTLKNVKGIKYLIKAINIVKEKGLKTKLLLIGDGEQKKELEKLSDKLNLKENVNFIGRVNNKEIYKYMVASDIFVLPSLSEGLPVVILEAMASGLPIIATKVGGVPEILKDKENGFLVDPKNSEQIAEKIIHLISNDNIRESISINNLKEAQKYSLDIVVEKLMGAYFLCKTKK